MRPHWDLGGSPSEAARVDPLLQNIWTVTAISMKLPSRFGFERPSVRAWGYNSCGLDAALLLELADGLPFKSWGDRAQK